MAKDTLTAGQIVRAAIEILDAEGLDGLNMRDLGKRLDSAATAVYWHVKSKDNLIRLAADEIWREVELPDLADRDWRANATAMAESLRRMLGRHPWLVQAFGSHLLYGPEKARHDDHSLALYEEAGFGPDEAERAASLVFLYVTGSTLGDAANVSLRRRLAKSGDPEEALRATMDQANAIAERFPRLRTRIGKPVSAYNGGPRDLFRYGLDTILDGLERRLAEA